MYFCVLWTKYFKTVERLAFILQVSIPHITKKAGDLEYQLLVCFKLNGRRGDLRWWCTIHLEPWTEEGDFNRLWKGSSTKRNERMEVGSQAGFLELNQEGVTGRTSVSQRSWGGPEG